MQNKGTRQLLILGMLTCSVTANAVADGLDETWALPQHAERPDGEGFRDLAKQVAPGIASLATFYKEHPDSARLTRGRQGCGFLVEEGRFILSLYHLLLAPGTERLSDRIEVSLHDGSTRNAAIVALEPTINLAILEIADAGNFSSLKIAPPYSSKNGDSIFAVARQKGGGQFGLSAGLLQFVPDKECYQDKLDLTLMNAVIDLPANAHGGPVFNANGEVIGISTINRHAETALSITNMSGREKVLPIQLAMNIYGSLKTKKSTRSPWTGFAVRRTTPGERVNAQNAVNPSGGLIIRNVWPNTTASRLDLRPSDILLTGSGKRLSTRDDLDDLLYENVVDTSIVLEFLRDSRIRKRDAKIQLRSGLEVKNVKPQEQVTVDGDDTPGGIGVFYVWPGSPASKAQLKRGDLILEIESKRLRHVADWNNHTQRLGPKQNVQLTCYRDEQPIQVSMDFVPWFGFDAGVLKEAERPRLNQQLISIHGIAIDYVWDNSPAQRWGIQRGDVLIKMNDESINSPADFQKWLYMYGVDALADFEFVRGNERFRIQRKIEARPKWAAPK